MTEEKKDRIIKDKMEIKHEIVLRELKKKKKMIVVT